MEYDPPGRMPDPNKPSDWDPWTHKQDPQNTLLVPRDVVLVWINERLSHLSRKGYSFITPIKNLPVMNAGDPTCRDYPAGELLRLYDPPHFYDPPHYCDPPHAR